MLIDNGNGIRNYFEDINFNGKVFNARTVDVPGWGERTIATSTLQDELIKDGEYTSEAARNLDEQIFFFMDDIKSFLYKSDKQLGRLIAREVA